MVLLHIVHFLFLGAFDVLAQQGPTDWIEVALVGLVNLMLWAIALAAVYWTLNRAGLPVHEAPATIVGHHHRDAYTTTNFVPISGVLMPMVQRHPEAWKLGVRVDGHQAVDWGNYGEQVYHDHSDGDRVIASYTIGRLDRTIAVRSFRPA